MWKQRILLVDDDERLGAQVVGHLTDAGFAVDWLRDGRAAAGTDPDRYGLWILDLMLPSTRGLDLLKDLRRASDVPVLVLSAQSDARVMIRAFQLGGDDYVTKPFCPEDLIARVHARMRRPTAVREQRLSFGNLVVDFDSRRLHIGGREVELTRVEFELFATLARRCGAAVQRDWLAERVLDPEREGTARTLDVHVSRLRKKLGERSGCIETVWGVGYRFDEACA